MSYSVFTAQQLMSRMMVNHPSTIAHSKPANATIFRSLFFRFIKSFRNFMPFMMSFAGTWQTGAPSFYDPNHIFIDTNPLLMSITLMQTK